MRWAFRLRRAGLEPDLFAFFWHAEPFEAVIVRGGWIAGEGLRLAVALHDLAGHWVWHESLPLNGELRFALDRFRDHSGKPAFEFPLKAVLLRAVGVRAGVDYELGLARLELEGATLPAALIDTPARARAGETMPCALAPEWSGAQLLLRHARGAIAACCESGEGGVRLSAALEEGDYVLEAWREGRLLARSRSLAIARVTPAPVPAAAQVALHRGAPAIHLDAAPHHGLAYMTYNPRADFVRQFAGADVRIVSLPTTANHHVFDLAPTVTPRAGRYDPDYMDLTVRTVLDADPRTLLLPRIYLGSAPWWDRAHADEIGVAEDRQGVTTPLSMVFIDTRLAKPCPSFASPRWQADALADLRRHLEHFATAPYADRVLGFLVAGGGSEEWFHWYDEENDDRWGDVGARHQEAFARAMIARYGSPAAVESAWQRPFGERPIPSRDRREHSVFRLLRDPEVEQDVIDFFRYHAEVMADVLLAAARLVKEVSHGRWLVGAFYGYLLHFTGACRHLNGGHFALRRVLDANVLDFLCAPTGYGHREPGDGFSSFMVPEGSVRLRGKLFYNENDLRTHLVQVPGGAFDRDFCRKEWGVTDHMTESIAIQRRELGHVLAKALPSWWFDLYPYGLYHEPAMMNEIEREVAIARAAMTLERHRTTEIAVLVDEESCFHERPEGSLFWHSVAEARESLARLGAPSTVFLLDDLPRLEPHRLYVFLNAWAPSVAVRAEVGRLRRQGRHLLFLGPAGVYANGRIDERGPADFIGLPIRLVREEGVLSATITGTGRLAAVRGATFGPGAFPPPYVQPEPMAGVAVEAVSPRGEPLMVSSDRRPGLTFFSAAPCPPHAILAAVARACGVHVYLESGDPIHVNGAFLSVHARTAGRKELHLAEARPLVDVFTSALASSRALTHTVEMAAAETRVFFLGEPDEWLRAIERSREGSP